VCEGVLCGLFCYPDIDSDYDVGWSDDSCMMNQRGFGNGHMPPVVIFLAFTWSGWVYHEHQSWNHCVQICNHRGIVLLFQYIGCLEVNTSM